MLGCNKQIGLGLACIRLLPRLLLPFDTMVLQPMTDDDVFFIRRHSRKPLGFYSAFQVTAATSCQYIVFYLGDIGAVCNPSLCRRLKGSVIFLQNYIAREERDKSTKEVELK